MKVADRYRIGKVFISKTTPKDAEYKINEAIGSKKNSYICVCNMRSVKYGNEHEDYAEVLNNSYMSVPDGQPLVWCAWAWGLKDVMRTNGPNLFVKMLNDTGSGVKHYLLGDTDETLNAIKEKFPNSCISGVFSPPFCELDEFVYQDIADRINKTDANIVWVSLRAPKQDYFAARLLPLLDHKVVIGVGAAFRFAIGKYHHPNRIIQELGLTGLFWRNRTIAQNIIWYSSMTWIEMKFFMNIAWRRIRGYRYDE